MLQLALEADLQRGQEQRVVVEEGRPQKHPVHASPVVHDVDGPVLTQHTVTASVQLRAEQVAG